jgi:preprotein translocase subunit SecF
MNIKPILQWNIIGKSKFLLTLALSLAIISIIMIPARGGLNLGIDFTGGLLMKANFEKEVTVAEIRASLAKIGFESATIQLDQKNKKYAMIRISENVDTELLLSTLETEIGPIVKDSMSVEKIGPVIGGELRRNALLTVLFALLMILIYTAIRFKPKHGVAAVVALVHDISVCLGVLALFRIQLNTPTIAALLAITAYSLQDSIVILDRLRENLKYFKDKMSFADLANKSVTESWTRSFFTSITTISAVVILTIYTGAALRDFTTILLVGLFAGTFSSIYIVVPFLVTIEHKKERIMKWDEKGRDQLISGNGKAKVQVFESNKNTPSDKAPTPKKKKNTPKRR